MGFLGWRGQLRLDGKEDQEAEERRRESAGGMNLGTFGLG